MGTKLLNGNEMTKWKNGVVRRGEVFYNDQWHTVELSREITAGLITFDDISKSMFDIETVITCGIEGLHSKYSLHPLGRAVDLRIWAYDSAQLDALVNEVRERLGKDYDIVIEKDHVHMEYDPK